MALLHPVHPVYIITLLQIALKQLPNKYAGTAYAYVCIYICNQAYIYVCMYVFMFVFMHASILVCMYVFMYICMYVCMNVYLYIRVYVCTFKCLLWCLYGCICISFKQVFVCRKVSYHLSNPSSLAILSPHIYFP